MDPFRNLRRARNDFALAAIMFAATSGSALWLANSMDKGEMLDIHGRLPQTIEAQEFASFAENVLLVPCAVLPLLSAFNLYNRRRKYEEAKFFLPAPHISA